MFPDSYTGYTKPSTYKRIIHSRDHYFHYVFWAKRGVNWRITDKTNLWNGGNPNTIALRWETCSTPLVSTLPASHAQGVFHRFYMRAWGDFSIKRRKQDRNHQPQRLNKFQWQIAHEWNSIEDHEGRNAISEPRVTDFNQLQMNIMVNLSLINLLRTPKLRFSM